MMAVFVVCCVTYLTAYHRNLCICIIYVGTIRDKTKSSIFLGCCGKYKNNKTSRIEMGDKFCLLFHICYNQETSGESVTSFARRTSLVDAVTRKYLTV